MQEWFAVSACNTPAESLQQELINNYVNPIRVDNADSTALNNKWEFCCKDSVEL